MSAVPILMILLLTLSRDMLNALLLRLNIKTARLALFPLSLQVSVVEAGLPTTCRMPRFVTLLVLPAVRCRVLPKHVGMATIVLAMALLRQVLVLCPSPFSMWVETLRGAQVPLLTLIA